MMSSPIAQQITRGLIAAAYVAATASCAGELARTGKGPAYLIVTSVTTLAGASSLQSDVAPTVPDIGRANIRAEMKNAVNPTTPTALNSITINRYRVAFRRADGRNTPGVDVPYGFDGATTATVFFGAAVAIDFDLVRRQNKEEPPLRNLIARGGSIYISAIAEVTFYGRDQAGNDVSVTGTIDVQFGDF